MSNGDLAFAGDSTGETGNLMYDLIFGAAGPSEEAPRTLGRKAKPAFDYYVLEFLGGKVQFTDEGAPGFSVMAKVIEGPEGTVDNSGVFGRQYLNVKATKTVKTGDGTVEVQRTPEEVQKAAKEIRLTLNRVNRVFGATDPAGLTEDALAVYVSQLSGGPVIAALSYRKERTYNGQTYPESNEIILRSIALPDDPVLDKQGNPTGQTALEQARQKIADFNRKSSAKNGSNRPTARNFASGSTPTEF